MSRWDERALALWKKEPHVQVPPPTISKTITVRLSAFSLNHGNVTLQRNKVFTLYIKQKGKYEAGEMM